MVKLKKGNIIEKKQLLIKNAYSLGYEVGYFHHDEYVGWVSSERSKLEDEAKKLKMLDEFEKRYYAGKSAGEKKASLDRADAILGAENRRKNVKTYEISKEPEKKIKRTPMDNNYMSLPQKQKVPEKISMKGSEEFAKQRVPEKVKTKKIIPKGM